MRTYKFETEDVNVRDDIADKILEMIKDNISLKLRDIMVCRLDDGEHHVLYLSFEGDVGAKVTFEYRDIVDGDKKSSTIVMDSNLFSHELEISKDVQVSVYWEEDIENRYKMSWLEANKNFGKKNERLKKESATKEITNISGIKRSKEGRKRISGKR